MEKKYEKKYLISFPNNFSFICSDDEARSFFRRWNPAFYEWTGYFFKNKEKCVLCEKYLVVKCKGCPLMTPKFLGCKNFFKSLGFYDEKKRRWLIKFFPTEVLVYEKAMNILKDFFEFCYKHSYAFSSN